MGKMIAKQNKQALTGSRKAESLACLYTIQATFASEHACN